MGIWILPVALVVAIVLGWTFSYLLRTGKFEKNGF